jgi:hypothetical protein
MIPAKIIVAYQRELTAYRNARVQNDELECTLRLSRAHVLSQGSVSLHLRTHWLMLGHATMKMDPKEFVGQLVRLFVTVPGHCIGKVPRGNTGWSTVGLTQQLPVPHDLQEILDCDSTDYNHSRR